MVENIDEKIPHLVEEVDEQLLEWTVGNKLSPDMMIAIVMARLTLVAKETNCEGHMIAICDKAKYNLAKQSEEKREILH